MRRFLVAQLLAALTVVLLALTGCAGFDSGPATTGATLIGRALVPAGTPTRAVAGDIPLPGADAVARDISAGLPGTVVSTVRTDNNGSYTFFDVPTGRSYVIEISKTVIGDNGQPTTLSIGSYVRIPTTTTGNLTADTDTSSTVALSTVLNQIITNPTLAGSDLTTVFRQVVTQFTESRQQGTAPTIDLSKPASDPQSHQTEAQQTVTASLQSGAFLSTPATADRGRVNYLYNKDTRQVDLVLTILDSQGDVFDADSFTGTANTDGTFSGTTLDGLYTFTGSMAGTSATGTWHAVSGGESGTWSAAVSSNSSTYRGVGFAGTFTRVTAEGNRGKWLLFVNDDGQATVYAYDMSVSDRRHLVKTAIISGTVSAAGAVSGGLVFPVVTGTVTGTLPVAGGTTTGNGSGSAGGHTGSGSGSITGNISGSTVTGSWSFSGLRDGSAFNASGTWTGIRR